MKLGNRKFSKNFIRIPERVERKSLLITPSTEKIGREGTNRRVNKSDRAGSGGRCKFSRPRTGAQSGGKRSAIRKKSVCGKGLRKNEWVKVAMFLRLCVKNKTLAQLKAVHMGKSGEWRREELSPAKTSQ